MDKGAYFGFFSDMEKQVWDLNNERCQFHEFKLGGLHEKQAVATCEPSQHSLEDRGKQRNPVSRWPVKGTSGYTLDSSPQSCVEVPGVA
jgi:hypothetical protein